VGVSHGEYALHVSAARKCDVIAAPAPPVRAMLSVACVRPPASSYVNWAASPASSASVRKAARALRIH